MPLYSVLLSGAFISLSACCALSELSWHGYSVTVSSLHPIHQFEEEDTYADNITSSRNGAGPGAGDYVYDEHDGDLVDSYADLALGTSGNADLSTNGRKSPGDDVQGIESSQSLMADMRDKITQKVIKMEELRRNREWKKSMDKRMEQLEEVRGRIQAKRQEIRQKSGPPPRRDDGSTPPDDPSAEDFDAQSSRSASVSRMEMNTAEMRYIRKAEFRKWRAHTRLELARRIGGTASRDEYAAQRHSPPMDDANDDLLYGDEEYADADLDYNAQDDAAR